MCSEKPVQDGQNILVDQVIKTNSEIFPTEQDYRQIRQFVLKNDHSYNPVFNSSLEIFPTKQAYRRARQFVLKNDHNYYNKVIPHDQRIHDHPYYKHWDDTGKPENRNKNKNNRVELLKKPQKRNKKAMESLNKDEKINCSVHVEIYDVTCGGYTNNNAISILKKFDKVQQKGLKGKVCAEKEDNCNRKVQLTDISDDVCVMNNEYRDKGEKKTFVDGDFYDPKDGIQNEDTITYQNKAGNYLQNHDTITFHNNTAGNYRHEKNKRRNTNSKEYQYKTVDTCTCLNGIKHQSLLRCCCKGENQPPKYRETYANSQQKTFDYDIAKTEPVCEYMYSNRFEIAELGPSVETESDSTIPTDSTTGTTCWRISWNSGINSKIPENTCKKHIVKLSSAVPTKTAGIQDQGNTACLNSIDIEPVWDYIDPDGIQVTVQVEADFYDETSSSQNKN